MSGTTTPSGGMAHGEDASDTAPRPKFSRRPASFSRATVPSAPVAVPVESASEPASPLPNRATKHQLPATIATTETPWQEDARFGIVMLVLILLVNLALVYGLPLLPASSAQDGPTQVAAKAPTMPNAINRRTNDVTLYSQPEEERRTIYLLDLHSTSDALSVSPMDIPPPTARALDSETFEE